jgi:hypothetical protein
MLRNIGLLHAEFLYQRTCGEFPVTQEFENRNSSRMRKRLKNVGLESS